MSATPSTELSVLLDEIEERTNKATPGPWFTERIGDGLYVGNKSSQSCGLWHIVHRSDMTDLRPSAAHQHSANADLIASARTDVPALVKIARMYALELACNARQKKLAELTAILNQGRAK